MSKKKALTKARDQLANKSQLLKPISLKDIGSNDDPCFGKSYDLTTTECKLCGDSELCCIKMAAYLGKTRKELEEENQYKDLDFKIDKPAVKKYFRRLKRDGKSKKEIVDTIQTKYELTLKESRQLYREFTQN